MFAQNHYIPILRCKQGEQIALRNLGRDLKQNITPLFEIFPPDWDSQNQKYKKTIQKQLESSARYIKLAWQENRSLFVSTEFIDETFSLKDGTHTMEHFLSLFGENTFPVIPVISFSCSPEYIGAAVRHGKNKKVGICIRIRRDDFNFTNVKQKILSLMKSHGLVAQDVDIIVDYQCVFGHSAEEVVYFATNNLNTIPKLSSWRSVILAGTGMPATLEMVKVGIYNFERTEYIVWKKLLNNKYIKRKPTFGDYTIKYHGENDLKKINYLPNPSASIRYTSDDYWLIFRGKAIRTPEGDYDNEQYRSHCKKLIKMQEYSGKKFSYGDKHIFDLATGKTEKCGTPGKWLQVGVSHHLTFVSDQMP